MQITVYEVKDETGVTHFESVAEVEGRRFISSYDREHGIVLELYAYERTPANHTDAKR